MPKIFYKELQKKLSSKTLDKVYFFYGEESGLMLQAEQALVKAELPESDNDFNIMRVNGDKLDVGNVSVYLNTYPVFCKNKCMIIRNLDITALKSDEISELIDLIQDVPEFSMLIINQLSMDTETFKNSAWKNFISKITPVTVVCEFSSRYNAGLEDQIICWAKSRGKMITFKLAKLLTQKCGTNTDILKLELDKLCAFEESDTITEDSIETITSNIVDYNVFSLCNSLLAGNYSDTFKTLENLFDNNENPILILSVIAGNYIDLFRVKAALEAGYSYSKVSDYFDYKSKAFKLEIASKNAYKMSMQQIKSSICELVNSDIELKTSVIPPKIVIYSLISRLIKIKERGIK